MTQFLNWSIGRPLSDLTDPRRRDWGFNYAVLRHLFPRGGPPTPNQYEYPPLPASGPGQPYPAMLDRLIG
ncbi:MAG TPA: hypothetical protein VII06_25580 [Chloroflexota bacterium]